MKTAYHHRLALIHQTSPENAEKIISTQQMIPSASGLFGPGVYFANTIEATNLKARQRQTYLIADVYVGKSVRISKDEATKGNINFQSFRSQFNSIFGHGMPTGREIIVFDPNRIKNIKYMYGTRPKNVFQINRNRIVLFYITDKTNAEIIVNGQSLMKSFGPCGNYIYLYDSITDAKNVTSGETYLAVDAIVEKCYNYSGTGPFQLPEKYKCFKTNYNGMIIYGFRNSNYLIKNIHYCGGVHWS